MLRMRLHVFWSMVSPSPVRERNCFGQCTRLFGQKRSPFPPAMMTAVSGSFVVCMIAYSLRLWDFRVFSCDPVSEANSAAFVTGGNSAVFSVISRIWISSSSEYCSM